VRNQKQANDMVYTYPIGGRKAVRAVRSLTPGVVTAELTADGNGLPAVAVTPLVEEGLARVRVTFDDNTRFTQSLNIVKPETIGPIIDFKQVQS
jgi:hypothetical protein